MKLSFYKYHGTGNDFILVDNREGTIALSKKQIERLCDRHFGVGADGLMLLTSEKGYDFGMVYFNADGNESTLCGNGGRCITAFAHMLGIIGQSARFLASDGEHTAKILKDEGNVKWVRLKMADVTTPPLAPPQQGRGVSDIETDKSSFVLRPSSFLINTGSPHLVIFVENVSEIDAVSEGRKLRDDPQFAPDGTNVDFVEIMESNLFVRTYERGVENETLSCGTGVTAAAMAYASWQSAVRSPQSAVLSPQSAVHSPQSAVRSPKISRTQHPGSSIEIETLGGKLTVSFRFEDGTFTDIWLKGPAEHVFSGEIEVRETRDERRGTRDEELKR
ncbi:MAG: diaminopimelate epimerase [Bacteroidota bacterium]